MPRHKIRSESSPLLARDGEPLTARLARFGRSQRTTCDLSRLWTRRRCPQREVSVGEPQTQASRGCKCNKPMRAAWQCTPVCAKLPAHIETDRRRPCPLRGRPQPVRPPLGPAAPARPQNGPRASAGPLAVYEPPLRVDDSAPHVASDYFARLTELLAAGRGGDTVEHYMTAMMGVPAERVADMRRAPFWSLGEALARTVRYDAGVPQGHTDRQTAARRALGRFRCTSACGGRRRQSHVHAHRRPLVDLLPAVSRDLPCQVRRTPSTLTCSPACGLSVSLPRRATDPVPRVNSRPASWPGRMAATRVAVWAQTMLLVRGRGRDRAGV